MAGPVTARWAYLNARNLYANGQIKKEFLYSFNEWFSKGGISLLIYSANSMGEDRAIFANTVKAPPPAPIKGAMSRICSTVLDAQPRTRTVTGRSLAKPQ